MEYKQMHEDINKSPFIYYTSPEIFQMEFWNSPEYQQAMKLREGIVEANFTVAIESAG